MRSTTPGDIDLHIHSSHSDGALPPADLVNRAADLGLSTIALADHDSVSGVAEATTTGRQLGVTVIPAVELSVRYEKWEDVHLLGYGIDHLDPGFLKHLHDFRQRREHRNEEILERINRRLARQGRRPVPLEAVLAFAGGAVGRPHIARALIERGYAENVEHSFQAYLIPCNVPKHYWPMDQAIAEVHRCGGIAVLAHPTSITRDREILSGVIAGLATTGLDGIEVYNNMASRDESDFLSDCALKQGLVMTGGSDFHGIEDGIVMGQGRDGIRFSDSLLAPLMERIAKLSTAGRAGA